MYGIVLGTLRPNLSVWTGLVHSLQPEQKVQKKIFFRKISKSEKPRARRKSWFLTIFGLEHATDFGFFLKDVEFYAQKPIKIWEFLMKVLKSY